MKGATKQVIMLAVVAITVLAGGTWAAAYDGPAYPPPGGVSWSGSGDPGKGTGMQWSYSNFDFAGGYGGGQGILELYWGPLNKFPSLGISVDDYSGVDQASEKLSYQSHTATTAVWMGQGIISWKEWWDQQYWESDPVTTRITITLSGAAQWVPVGAVPGTLPDAYDVVARVTGDYTARILAEFDGPAAWWRPVHDEFNRLETYPSHRSFCEVQAGFWSLPFAQAGKPGDCNLDGSVNDDDLSLQLAHWGQDVVADADGGWGNGEFNRRAPVGDDDLSLLLANWSGPVNGGPTPEPATLGLLLAGGLAVLRRRRP